MRAGRKMVQVHIVNIFKGMIGIGRLIHPTKIGGLILVVTITIGNHVEIMQAIHYLITIQFWVLTGNFIILSPLGVGS